MSGSWKGVAVAILTGMLWERALPVGAGLARELVCKNLFAGRARSHSQGPFPQYSSKVSLAEFNGWSMLEAVDQFQRKDIH
jgi:hypothetical protein